MYIVGSCLHSTQHPASTAPSHFGQKPSSPQKGQHLAIKSAVSPTHPALARSSALLGLTCPIPLLATESMPARHRGHMVVLSSLRPSSGVRHLTASRGPRSSRPQGGGPSKASPRSRMRRSSSPEPSSCSSSRGSTEPLSSP
eukprot:scaffold12080_cov67-Phaeocystis_antarctica.AAC.12